MKKILFFALFVLLLASLVSGWTDNILSSNTPIKKAHVEEARTDIDALRADVGLAGYSWTDPVLTTNTPVKAVHFSEQTTAMNDIYTLISIPTVTALASITPSKVIAFLHMNLQRDNFTYLNDTVNSYRCCGSYNGANTGSVGACPGSDDSSCGNIDCDALDSYFTSGGASPTGTNYCMYRNYADLTTDRCEGVNNCKDANTGDCTSYSDVVSDTCDSCQYASGACSSCSNYVSGTSCGYGWDCNGAGTCESCQECTEGTTQCGAPNNIYTCTTYGVGCTYWLNTQNCPALTGGNCVGGVCCQPQMGNACTCDYDLHCQNENTCLFTYPGLIYDTCGDQGVESCGVDEIDCLCQDYGTIACDGVTCNC